MQIRLLSTPDVRKCITIEEAIHILEKAFIDLTNQQIVLPPSSKIPINDKKAIFYLTPVIMKATHNFGIKFLSSFPKNIEHHQPQKNSCIVLIDSDNGLPKVLIDNRYLRQIRTGALSGLATKLFTAPEADTLAIIGAGPQSFKQFEAISAVRPIKSVYIWSKSLDHAMKLAHEIPLKLDINVTDKLSDAVADADIISTVAPSKSPSVFLQHIKHNAHINLIGPTNPKHRELDDDILKNGVFCVDLVDEAIHHCGELKYAIKHKIFSQEGILKIGEYLLNPEPDYTNHLTIFRPMGLSFADMALANIVYQNAVTHNLGTLFDFD